MAKTVELPVADNPDNGPLNGATSTQESADLSAMPIPSDAIVETNQDRRRHAAAARWRFAERLNAGPFTITPDWQETINNYKQLRAERIKH